MLMIVAHHFSVHGGFSFPASSITINRLYIQFIHMGGSLGNNIFVMLSGYFLIKSTSINPRRLLNLWARIFVWSTVIFAAFVWSGIVPFSLKSAVKSLMPVTRSQWWFATAYFVMYLIHPYVNRLLHTFTRGEYRTFLLSILVYWCMIPTLTRSTFGANSTVNFVCLYSLAGYVRLYPEDFGTRRFILWGALFAVGNFLSVIAVDVLDSVQSYFTLHPYYFLEMMRPFTVAAALCLLVGFTKLKIPHSRVINTLASATFGVYLIHDSNIVRPFLWHEIFRNASFQESPYLIPYSVAVILTVYTVCTILESARSRIFRALSGGRLS